MSTINTYKWVLILVCVLIGVSVLKYTYQEREVVIADFNTPAIEKGDAVYNNIGGQYGVWHYSVRSVSSDKIIAPEQGCSIHFVHDDPLGNGYALQLSYNIEQMNSGSCGFWMKMKDCNLSYFDTIHFYIKGDEHKGYPLRVCVEIKDPHSTSTYYVEGVSPVWQKVSIPFENFFSTIDWSSIEEFVIVFDSRMGSNKSGTVYIDNISVSKKKGQKRAFFNK